jgi:predicted Fe-S protein YdhL (DUF1289 family)
MVQKPEGNVEMYMGQTKWAELAAWETLDEATKKEIIQRKLDQRIMHKEFKLGYIKHKVETLKMIKQAMKKK